MTRTRTAAIAALAISSALVLAACGGGSSSDSSASGDSNLSGAVRIDGSSTVYPLTALAAVDFMAANPGVQVTGVFPGAIGTNISINSGIMTEEQAKQMAASAGDQARKTTAPAEAGRQIIEAVEKGSYEIFIGGDAKAMSRLSRLNQKSGL